MSKKANPPNKSLPPTKAVPVGYPSGPSYEGAKPRSLLPPHGK